MRTTRTVVFLGLLAAAFLLLRNGAAVKLAAEEGLTLCIRSVLPSLFPFFVLSSLLLSLGFAESLGRLLAPAMEFLFHLGGNGAAALALGLIAGYPSGARAVTGLYQQKLCGKEEAEQLLAFCNNCGPAFFLSFLGAERFGSTLTGMRLWLIHVLSALISGILLRPQRTLALASPAPRRNTASFSLAFTEAVQSAVSSYLSVCGFVLLFSVLLQPLKACFGSTPFLGFFELFSGASMLDGSKLSFVLAAAISSWGGLSVHAQSAAFFAAAGLNEKWYFRGKALQTVLSTALAAALVLL